MAGSDGWRRRGWGTGSLLAAAAMLVSGETVLQERLRSHPWEFLGFWLACFLCVCLALVTALLELRGVRRQLRKDQEELVQSTLRQIDRDKAARRPPPPQNSGR